MNKTLVVLILVAIAAVAAYFIFRGYSAPMTMPNPGGTPNGQVTPPAQGDAVSIINFSFQPSPLTVKAGTTVTWTNNDSTDHQIKSNTFNSAILSKGQTFSFTFTTPGTYDYSCAIHPSMKGQIIVQ